MKRETTSSERRLGSPALTVLFMGLVLLAPTGAHAERPSAKVLVTSEDNARVTSELGARILALSVQVGQNVQKDDVIVLLDCSYYEANLAVARRMARERQRLDPSQFGATDDQSMWMVRKEIARMTAALDAAEVVHAEHLVEKCVIRAPVDGFVVERNVEVYERVTPGQLLMQIGQHKSVAQ